MIEQDEEWLVGHRHLSARSLDAILTDLNKNDKEDLESSPEPR